MFKIRPIFNHRNNEMCECSAGGVTSLRVRNNQLFRGNKLRRIIVLINYKCSKHNTYVYVILIVIIYQT